MTEMLLAFTTFPNEEDAARAMRVLLEERLIACANLLPHSRSLFIWQGRLEDTRETVVLIKTRKQDWPAMMSRLHELHPYKIPECIAVRIASGSPAYLEWLEAALAADRP